LKPLSQRLRRFAYVLVGVTVVLVCSWLWLQFVFLNGGVKTQVQQALASAMKGHANIGSVRADWKADLVFENVSFTVPAGRFEARVTVPQTFLSLRYVDLIFRKKPIEQCLKSVVFDSPKVVWAPAENRPRPSGGGAFRKP